MLLGNVLKTGNENWKRKCVGVNKQRSDLREQEERVRLAVEAADIGTWDFNPLTGEQEWSSRAKDHVRPFRLMPT